MKNLMNCAKKTIICVVIALVFFFSSVSPAHAIDPVTGTTIIANTLASIASLITIGSSESWGEAKWQEVIDEIDSVWRVTPSYSNVVEITTDQLYDLYLDACEKGFPCRIVERPIAGSWYYCIEGTGVVANLPNAYFSWFTEDDVDISSRILTAADGWAYVSDDPWSSNYLLLQILNKLDPDTDPDDGVGYWIYQITLHLNNISNKLDNLSISGGSLDVTPIVNKLQTVIDSADERLTLLLSDLDGHVDTIVDAIPDPVDLTPVNDRIDTLIEEVRKISTYNDRQEVEVVIPGVFGKIHSWLMPDGWRLVQSKDSIELIYDGAGDRVFDSESEYPYQICAMDVVSAVSDCGYLDFYLSDYSGGMYSAAEVTITDAARDVSRDTLYVEFYDYSMSCIGSITSDSSYYSNVVDFDECLCVRVYTAYDGWPFTQFGDYTALVDIYFGSMTYPSCNELTLCIDQEWFTIDIGDPRFDVLPGSRIWWTASEGWGFDDADGRRYYGLYCEDELVDAFTPPDRTEMQISNNIYTWFEWFYNNANKSTSGVDVTPIVSKLKDIENALANMGSDIDIENNTNININEENENYNIFYVDDPDGGEDKSIVDLSGDTLKVFGKLLDFLYKVSFKGALDNAGSGIGDLSDFYLDTSEGSADLWAS